MTQKELYELAENRKEETIEIHSPNDFYGHATILKKYAGMPPDYQLKTVIEHGAYLSDYCWDVEINAPLPGLLIASSNRYPFLKNKTNKMLFSIGSLLYYASHFLDDTMLKSEKQRLGRNLLVFPAHSTHHINVNYNIKHYCDIIKKLGNNFDTVRVCLYWKDILMGHSEEYMKYGFECITAGHMFDPLFLPRLKSIIELSDITASNNNGTHIGYSILMGKPHYFYRDELEVTAVTKEIINRDTVDRSFQEKHKKILEAFSVYREEITPLHKEISHKYWGIDQVKTPEEIRLIFQVTEDMYKKGNSFFMSHRNLLVEQATEYLNINKNREALFLLEQAIEVNPEIPELNYGKAISLARMGKKKEAIELLKHILRIKPVHVKAELLLDELFLENNGTVIDTPEAYNMEAEIAFKHGDKDRAKDILLNIIKRWPDDNRALNNLGLIYWTLGETEKSLEAFVKAFKNNPDNRNTVLNLADIMIQLEKYDRAATIYSSYLEIYPYDLEIKNLLLNLEGNIKKKKYYP